MKRKEEGHCRKCVSLFVLVGLILAGTIPMRTFGEGPLPYYDIEQDSLGNYHKAYLDNMTGNFEVYYTNDIGGNFSMDWNPSKRISFTDNDSLLLDLGIYQTNDTMFIIWSEITVEVNLTYYTFSRDYGESWREPNRSYEEILLKYAQFDPLIEEPELPSIPEGNGTTYAYYLVQMKTPMIQEWWDGIEAAGGIFCGYIPNNAYVLNIGTHSAKNNIEQLPYIRWIGYYHPLYKIQSGLLNISATNSSIIELNVLVIKETDGQDNLNNTIERIIELGGNITYNGSESYIIRTQINASKIYDIALIQEVKWIGKYRAAIPFMNYIRQFTGVKDLFDVNLRGSGIVGEVRDFGCDFDHFDLDNVVHKDGFVFVPFDEEYDPEGHGTCTTGVIFSNGLLDGDGKSEAMGILPEATGAFALIEKTDRTLSIRNLDGWEGVFQSNSWGTPELDGKYTEFSVENDQLVFDYDITMAYGVGNSNNGVYSYTISRDSAAKNIISVGGVDHFDDTDLSNDEWINDGTGKTPSQGPAWDGRIKPDLCGPADHGYVTDSVDGDGVDGIRTGNYVTKSTDKEFAGTSLATPVVAGASGLVYEMYRDNHFGNNPTGEDPHASTVKALLIANAHQYDLSKATRMQQGWGMVDVDRIYEIGDDHLIVDEDKPIHFGTAHSYAVYTHSGQPFKVSLVWTDPPGDPEAYKALVNDIGIQVKDPDGVIYNGNYGLKDNLWSVPGGSNDGKNNVENVFIQNPKEGKYIIYVFGLSLNIDAYSETSEIDQPYALVVSCDQVEKVTKTIPLYAGWNLLSLPLHLKYNNYLYVFKSIDGYYNHWQTYNGKTQTWNHHPYYISILEGFWLHIINCDEIDFVLEGWVIYEDQEITLYPEWNLVGYPSQFENERNKAIDPLDVPDPITVIQWYEREKDEWHFLEWGENFVPGWGYWFYYDGTWGPEVTWIVPHDKLP